MLPGLWQILFSLGVFASYRLLPSGDLGGRGVLSGLRACSCLALGEGALSPWAMGVPFAVGQGLAAAVLYWNLERGDVEGI